jgi:hypothetical protein
MTKIVIFGAMKNIIQDILAQTGARDEIAKECNVAPIAVYRWAQNASIPSRHFAGVLRVAERNGAAVTAEVLCAAHDKTPSAGPTARAS